MRGKLTGVPVTVVSLGADPADTRAVAELVVTAGGSVAGRSCSPRPSPTRPAPTSCATCPRDCCRRGAAPHRHRRRCARRGLLGSALLTPPDGPAPAPDAAGTVLAGLAGGGFAEAPQGSPAAGRLAVVVTGAAYSGVDADASAGTAAALAAELDRRGAGAVLAGRDAAEGSAVAAARAAGAGPVGRLATVDGVGTGAGRVATVLALAERQAGGTGRYGSGAGTAGPVPAAP